MEEKVINIAENKANFKNIVKMYIKREGIDELINYLETTDFFEAPASTRFHGACEGGLVAHSIAVARQIFKLSKLYKIDCTEESLAIVSLFHDLCKANFYGVEMRNKKNEVTGQWEKVPAYKVEEQLCYGGHGSKSVFLVMEHMKLTWQEASAINTHMGFSDKSPNAINEVSSCYENNALAWLLHVADEAATYIDGI